MPSMRGITRYDKYLTNLAIAWPTGNKVASLLCPIVPVDRYSDKIFVDGDDAITRTNNRAEGVPSNQVDFTAGTGYSFRTFRRALSTVITEKEKSNVDAPVNIRDRNTGKLTNRLRNEHEVSVANFLTNTSYVTNYTNVDATPNYRLDESTPSLENDIITAKNSIYSKTGQIANVIEIPYEAAQYAAKIAFIKDSLIYSGQGMQYVSGDYQGQLRQFFGLPPMIKGLRVIVSTGRVDSAVKGQTKSVANPWGKHIIIGYVPEDLNTMTMFGMVTAEYSPFRVASEAQTDPMGEKIVVEWDYDLVQANFDCFYLLQNEIG